MTMQKQDMEIDFDSMAENPEIHRGGGKMAIIYSQSGESEADTCDRKISTCPFHSFCKPFYILGRASIA
eukprot:scaffold4513_cov101-Cylindrotheca_fusiformis.AAC.1